MKKDDHVYIRADHVFMAGLLWGVILGAWFLVERFL